MWLIVYFWNLELCFDKGSWNSFRKLLLEIYQLVICLRLCFACLGLHMLFINFRKKEDPIGGCFANVEETQEKISK